MNVEADGSVRVPVESDDKIVQAQLHYTIETGLRSERHWYSKRATISDGMVIAHGLPPEANTWIITLLDDRRAMVSTEVGFR